MVDGVLGENNIVLQGSNHSLEFIFCLNFRNQISTKSPLSASVYLYCLSLDSNSVKLMVSVCSPIKISITYCLKLSSMYCL